MLSQFSTRKRDSQGRERISSPPNTHLDLIQYVFILIHQHVYLLLVLRHINIVLYTSPKSINSSFVKQTPNQANHDLRDLVPIHSHSSDKHYLHSTHWVLYSKYALRVRNQNYVTIWSSALPHSIIPFTNTYLAQKKTCIILRIRIKLNTKGISPTLTWSIESLPLRHIVHRSLHRHQHPAVRLVSVELLQLLNRKVATQLGQLRFRNVGASVAGRRPTAQDLVEQHSDHDDQRDVRVAAENLGDQTAQEAGGLRVVDGAGVRNGGKRAFDVSHVDGGGRGGGGWWFGIWGAPRLELELSLCLDARRRSSRGNWKSINVWNVVLGFV